MIYLSPPQLFLPAGSTDLGQPGASSSTFEAFPAIGGTSLTFSFLTASAIHLIRSGTLSGERGYQHHPDNIGEGPTDDRVPAVRWFTPPDL